MKETKQGKSIPRGEKSTKGKKGPTKGKTNPMGTAFDLSGSTITMTPPAKKIRKPRQAQDVKQTQEMENTSKKSSKKQIKNVVVKEDKVQKPLDKQAKSTAKTKKPTTEKKKKPVKVIFLGGVGEIGKNMTAFEYGHDIIVVDAGLTFPGEDMPGVDSVVPMSPIWCKIKIKFAPSF